MVEVESWRTKKVKGEYLYTYIVYIYVYKMRFYDMIQYAQCRLSHPICSFHTDETGVGCDLRPVDNDSQRSYFTRGSSIIHAVNNAGLFHVILYIVPCPPKLIPLFTIIEAACLSLVVLNKKKI